MTEPTPHPPSSGPTGPPEGRGPTDRLLRDEIRWLGRLLGEVLQEQAGRAAFERVERVRALAKARRAGDPGAEAELVALFSECHLEELAVVVQAFSIFFDLANLAEDRQRVRVIRHRERTRSGPRGETLEDAVAGLARAGLDAGAICALLDATGVEFVFTAHPTEAKRRSVREKVRDIRVRLYALDDADLLPRERTRLEDGVRADLTALWQTELIRFRRPTVLEELDRSLFFAGNLWSVVPRLHEELSRALHRHVGRDADAVDLVRFGTWIGGDRDGNPTVTAAVTEKALAVLRAGALRRHVARAAAARRSLGVSSRRVGVSRELVAETGSRAKQWPELAAKLDHLSASEPYRRWLRAVQWRLERTLDSSEAAGAYRRSEEFVRDLRLLRASLAENGGRRLAEAYVDEWLLQARVFGFHLMRMDVRQESGHYHAVLDELFAKSGMHAAYGELEEGDRRELLGASMAAPPSLQGLELSNEVEEVLALFRLLARECRLRGPGAFGGHVVSMTHRPSDILAVLWLARWAAVREELPGGRLPVPIVPLFETIDDLARAPAILDELLREPAYRAHVSDDNDRQVVMVGYSDSTKDGGYMAASWHLYEAQRRMRAPAETHGVRLVLFHGRGGALGRGGGPAARHVASLPPGTLRPGMRITEQGEVLAERYDDPEIARRHLQQVLSALVLRAGQYGTGRGERAEGPTDDELLARLALSSREAYRELVERPGFVEYFEQATPLRQIERLAIGSRPARRQGEASLENLRAIPWVFSWTQSRHLLPAWYGLGAAVDSLEEAERNRLGRVYRHSAFFRATIENAALALAKADMGIARIHAGLVSDPDLRADVFGRIEAEYERSCAAVLRLTGRSGLLADIAWLERSIDVRNPYVDPLNLIQVELFRRWRDATEGSPDRERIEESIRLTIQGIAGGLRTTG